MFSKSTSLFMYLSVERQLHQMSESNSKNEGKATYESSVQAQDPRRGGPQNPENQGKTGLGQEKNTIIRTSARHRVLVLRMTGYWATGIISRLASLLLPLPTGVFSSQQSE